MQCPYSQLNGNSPLTGEREKGETDREREMREKLRER